MAVKGQTIKVDWCTVTATGTLHCKLQKIPDIKMWGGRLRSLIMRSWPGANQGGGVRGGGVCEICFQLGESTVSVIPCMPLSQNCRGKQGRGEQSGKLLFIHIQVFGGKMIIWSNLMFKVKNNNIHLSCGSLVMARLKRYLNKIIFHCKKFAELNLNVNSFTSNSWSDLDRNRNLVSN